MLTPASSSRSARSSSASLGARKRAVVLAFEQPGVDELADEPARSLPQPLVHLGEGHRRRVIVGPARAQRFVDAEPLGHRRAVLAGPLEQRLDRFELEAARLELGDELESFEVRRVVARVATFAAGRGQHAFGLVVANGAAAHAGTLGQLVEAELLSSTVAASHKRDSVHWHKTLTVGTVTVRVEGMQTRTAAKAAQLVAASARATLDPFTEIDWSIDIVDDRSYHLPPEKLPALRHRRVGRDDRRSSVTPTAGTSARRSAPPGSGSRTS